MARKQRVPVTERALIQRINRRLSRDLKQLKTSRTANTQEMVGKYFVVDTFRNAVIETNVDPEEFGRKLEVLQLWEEVVSGE